MNAPAPRPTTAPEVQWTPLPGRAFTLRFSMKAIAALKDLWGLKSEQEIETHLASMAQSGELGTNEMVQLIWAATRTHHPEVTQADIWDLLDDAGLGALGDLSSVLERLIGSARPDAPDTPRPPAAAAKTTP